MKDYKRLTVKREDGEATIGSNIRIQVLINRLAKLEDEIEDGTLIPRYWVDKDCGFYCVCEVNTQDVYILAQCKTEAEAQKKLEELTK